MLIIFTSIRCLVPEPIFGKYEFSIFYKIPLKILEFVKIVFMSQISTNLEIIWNNFPKNGKRNRTFDARSM